LAVGAALGFGQLLAALLSPVSSPCSHTVQARATDLDGVTQTEVRADPIPNGASAWPATIFTVS